MFYLFMKNKKKENFISEDYKMFWQVILKKKFDGNIK